MKKVLLVDDELFIIKALGRLLERHGFQVFMAQSGAEALRLMQRTPCQVVLTDFRMPEMNGAELLRQIKQQFPHSIRLVLSGYSDFNTVLELLNEGLAARFLQKPWEDQQMVSMLTNAFDTYWQQRHAAVREHQLLSTADPLLEVDLQGTILRQNAGAERLLGTQHIQLKDRLDDLLSGMVTEIMLGDGLHPLEARLHYKDEHALLLALHQPEHFAQDRVVMLPEIPDQSALVQLIDSHLQQQIKLAVVALRLTSYGEWADLHGYQQAGELLATVSESLHRGAVRQGAVLGFLANELFLLLLPRVTAEMQVHQRLGDLLQSVQQNLAALQKTAVPAFSVSYAMAPEDGGSGKELVSNVLICNRLQQNSHSRFFSRYSPQLADRKRQQLRISDALYRAIDSDQLQLYFQPKLDLTHNNCHSAEALLRWQHPEFGMVSPALFIPVAEQYGQIHELGLWVLRQVCARLPELAAVGIRQVAVNVSAVQLQQPDFTELVSRVIAQSGVDPAQLELELTESVMLTEPESSLQKLRQLKALGLGLALDDFGTGYSSLAVLNRLPVDTLKIDRSMISELEVSLASFSMVSNVTRMAHELGMKVVVEGVETEEQLVLLRQLGCDEIQGFHYCKPVPLLALPQCLAAQGS